MARVLVANFGVQLVRNYIDGLILSNAADTANDITISAGTAMDSTNVAQITLASALTKQLDANWIAGTNSGGLDTGSRVANTTYHVYVIKNPDSGSTDVLFSTGATTPNLLPSGYSLYRRIGAIVSSASNQNYQFQQIGDEFLLNPGFNFTTVTVNTSQTSVPFTGLPTGVIVTPLFIPTINSITNGQNNVVNFCTPGLSMAAPSSYIVSPTGSSMRQGYTNSGALSGEASIDAQNPTVLVSTIPTSTGAINAQVSVSGTTLNIYLLGWKDRRGKA